MNFKAELATRSVNISALARALGISRQALYSKIEGRTEFTVGEIKTISVFLRLTPEDREALFFAPDVYPHETNNNEE